MSRAQMLSMFLSLVEFVHLLLLDVQVILLLDHMQLAKRKETVLLFSKKE